jgi:hypothetical protein
MTIKDIIHAAFYCPMGNLFSSEEAWGLPLLFHGPPGSTKTSTMRGTARKNVVGGRPIPFEGMKPGARGEGGFGVTPVPKRLEGGEVVLDFPPPAYLVQKFAGGVGLLLVDELNTAPPALQPPLLGLVQERELGVHFFGARVRIFGATNTVDEAAGGWDLAPAVANRLGHIDWPDPTIEEWTSWLLNGARASEDSHVDVEAEEKRVLHAWNNGAWATACGMIAGFMRRQPELFRQQPASTDPRASRAWASPRSWEYATRAYAASIVHGLDKRDTQTLVCAFVGEGPGAAFTNWMKQQDLPDPAEFLDGKVSFEHSVKRLDRTQALLSACAALLVPETCTRRKERAAALWKFLGTITDDAADLGAPIVHTLWQAKLVTMKESRPVLASMEAVVNAVPSGR